MVSAATITRGNITPALSVQIGGQARLARHPRCRGIHLFEVQIMGKKWRANARIADAEERAKLWPKLVDLYFDYDNYQRWTDRVIPVVVLDPV